MPHPEETREYLKGKRHGNGVEEGVNGHRYEGEFHDDKRCGLGVLTVRGRRAGVAEACGYLLRFRVQALAVDGVRVAADVRVSPRAIGLVPRLGGRVLTTHLRVNRRRSVQALQT